MATWKDLLVKGDEPPQVALPQASIVVPTKNHGAEIGFTLETLLSQDHPNLEILLIDAGSTDRTLEIVNSFRSEKIKILSVSQYNPAEMWNRGIMASKGDYLNFLEPGSGYLFQGAVTYMMELSALAHHPLVVYSSYLKKRRRGETELILWPLNKKLMRKGVAPSSFEACWFSIEAFKKVGTFSTDYESRGGFEFLARLSRQGGNVYAYTTRVVTDAPIRQRRERERWLNFKERWRAIRHHFGTKAALRWAFNLL